MVSVVMGGQDIFDIIKSDFLYFGCGKSCWDWETNLSWILMPFLNISVPNVSFQSFAPGFVSRFIESHAVMLQGNAGLKPKEGEYTSRPWEWPINLRVRLFLFTIVSLKLFFTETQVFSIDQSKISFSMAAIVAAAWPALALKSWKAAFPHFLL